jgi:hypothetical protein
MGVYAGFGNDCVQYLFYNIVRKVANFALPRRGCKSRNGKNPYPKHSSSSSITALHLDLYIPEKAIKIPAHLCSMEDSTYTVLLKHQHGQGKPCKGAHFESSGVQGSSICKRRPPVNLPCLLLTIRITTHVPSHVLEGTVGLFWTSPTAKLGAARYQHRTRT